MDLAIGGSVEDALALVERSCSLAGTSHRQAFVTALESLAGIEPDRTSRVTRVLFAEVERILARLWTITLAARAAGVPRHECTALDQRETLFAALRQATGQRVFWAAAVPGGIRSDFTHDDLGELRAALQTLETGLPTWRSLAGPRGPLGQSGRGAGKFSAERVAALGLSGIAAGGSGGAYDLRRSDPYGGYNDLTIDWPAPVTPTTAGDAATRLAYAVEDMAASVAIALECLDTLAGATTASAQPFQPGPTLSGREAAATVEGPHGPVTVAVALTDDGRIARLRLETPSIAALDALSELLEGQPLSLAPLVLASVDLCPECLDL